jgi:flagellar motility protein MotE (MotC chaperone)
MFPQLRVLPVLILLCCFMLAQRLESIWLIGQAIAAEAEAKPEHTPPTSDAEAKANEPAAEAKASPDAAKPADGSADTAAAKPDAYADPLLFNDSELDILQSLSARRGQLDERERAIEQKEGLLSVTEQRIDQKLQDLKTLRAELESAKQDLEKLTKQVDDKESEKMAGLVKAYEAMKPKDAARIFDQLEMPVLLGIMGKMKDAKMSPILAAMDPAKAKAVTTDMAQKKTLKPSDTAATDDTQHTKATGAAENLPPGPPKQN